MPIRRSAITSARSFLERFDISIDRFSRTTPARRMRFIDDQQINLVLDVGAHAGEYGLELRRGGYQGRIESFEPVPRSYEQLTARSAADSLWRCHQLVVASKPGTLAINVAENEVSSSVLPMMDRHTDAAPGSGYVGVHEAEAMPLDDLDLVSETDRAYLKLDVQGFEAEVMAGARRILERVRLAEVELSLVPLYEDGPLYLDMIQQFSDLGFEPIWFHRGFQDRKTGRLLQMDGIFARSV